MTLQSNVLKHWSTILYVACIAGLATSFGFVNPETEIAGGVKAKFVMLAIAALGAYTVSLVSQALKARTPARNVTVQPVQEKTPVPSDSDVFGQFGK